MTAAASRTAPSGSLSNQLSAAEEELWLLEQDSGGPAYLVPFAVWVDGPLDVPTLADALHEVVARHDILRTVVRSVEGTPVREVLLEVRVPCPMIPVESDAEAIAEAQAMASKVFVDGESRVRAAVFGIHDRRWLLTVVLHHAVCDASSLWVLLEEVAALYSAAVQGRQSDLPDPVQVATIRAAELARDASGETDRLCREVADTVRSAPDIVNLPYDHMGGDDGLPAGRLIRMALPAQLNETIERTARRLAVSPNAVLLAAYGVLLDIIAGADDVVVSVPVSLRRSAVDERVIGFLVHSVPVRVRVGRHNTVDTLIAHAWAALRQGWTHADVSFGRVVTEVNPQRVPGMNPLCQCEFSVQTLPDRLPTLGSASLRYQFIHNGGAKFSLSLEIVKSAEGRAVAIECPANRFLPGTLRRLANLYVRVLTALTANNAGRLADLELMTRAERVWLAEHAGTQSTRQPVPVADRIEAAIRDRPMDLAVVAPDDSLTYRELGVLADNLVAGLRTAGVTPGARIAVLGERSAKAVVAVVAAIRAGMSFVAISDDVPARRLAEMLAVVEPAAVVASAPLFRGLPESWRANEMSWGDGWRMSVRQEPAQQRTGEAYVVFTSGSTGAPRGVSVPSTAIAAITSAWGVEFGLAGAPGRHLQLAPFSFDVFVGDLARALCFGGTLVLAARDDALDPARLAGLIQREHVDTVEFVPAVARLLVDYLEQADEHLPTLRRVMVGSDTWHAADARRLRALLPTAARLYCTYGTSESSVDATVFDIGPADSLTHPVVPIGRPFPGVVVSVRDRLGRELPPLWAGELWIGGTTVASGYLPSRSTASDRFGIERGPGGLTVRWYRTGDRAVWDQRGYLRLLGRVDTETKINGVRVHPAEIESVLCGHPAVTAAAVVTTDHDQRRSLVAFVVGPDQSTLDDIAAHARRHLLAAAVPNALHVLDRIPTTRHGKVDYATLVERAVSRPAAGHVAPSTEVEGIVAAVCADILDLPEIGVTEDFYALGGSSIHLARITWRVSRATRCPLSVHDVVRSPSVRALARLVEQHPRQEMSVSDEPDTPRPLVVVTPPSTTSRAPVPPERVVLTGATGALGPGVLRALLASRGVAEVACLVRADGLDHARARTRAALDAYGADPNLADDPRLRYHPADLAKPNAGLSTADLEAVTHADAIVNVAAWVNFLYPYEVLAPVNVDGVAKLAQLAGQTRIKSLHHLSTRSAVSTDGRRPAGGYNESKAAAELVAVRGREVGMPVSVYRPGFVLGRLSVRPPRPGLLESFLRECVRTGTAPALPGRLNVVSADHVTVRIVTNVLSPSPVDDLDLVGAAPLSWTDAWATLRAHGVALAEVSVEDWMDRVGEGWFEPFLPLCASVGLPALLSEDMSATGADPDAQPVADAWGPICARLAELAGAR